MKSTTHSTIPMKYALLGALAMAWAWGVIAGSVGLNALIKSNQQQSKLRKNVPPPTVVSVNVNDVFHTGVVLTTVAALIAVLCSIFILMLLVPFTRVLATRSLRIQSAILAFCATWLFATLIPFEVYFANRSAKVTARIGSLQLPQSIIQQAEKALGVTSVYRKISYLRLVAILPWITVLFTFIAATVMFMAASRVGKTESAVDASTQDPHPDSPTAEKSDA